MEPTSARPERYGTALIVTGPSGAGKTTVCRRLLERVPELHFSVSCTTRPRRDGEQDGRDYHFLDRTEFEERVAAGDFLEYAQVHGEFYGTLRSEVERSVAGGQDVLLDIDVQGARQVRQNVADSWLQHGAVHVFFGPPSVAELERRLRGRGTDSEDVIQRRLANARDELQAWREFDYVVINDDVDAAAERLGAILAAPRHALPRCPDLPPWAE